jgi:prevent-host-death family protein
MLVDSRDPLSQYPACTLESSWRDGRDHTMLLCSRIEAGAGGAMKQTTVNVRELKTRLSHYLRLAKAGESIEITERGVPIGRIVPTGAPIEDRMEAMARTGLLQWDQRRLPPAPPVARASGPRTVAELLVEDRE